ncbi:MAG TPA: 6,7-dimethyl-8-ribityllumazine synthase [Candidatus Paceibacterota bacterium]|nr:6,7-dimethyl-8-ribityllumazine synthase [Candidatus Paceibacterota bacterium]
MQRKKKGEKIIFPDGSKLKIGIVVSKYYEDITGSMFNGALGTLEACGVKKKNIFVVPVPGSFEIPFGCNVLIKKKKCDAIVTLGCIIKGETDHDRHIASAIFSGITKLSLDYGVPISLGVINANNLAQAKARSAGDNNKGKDAALAAVEMALIG